MTSPELARHLTELSVEIGRQVGVLLNRKGQIEHVMVGDAHGIELPDFGRQRAGGVRLRGLRLVHTHLAGEPINRDDLNDLALLRLDMVAALEVRENGLPGKLELAYLLPANDDGRLWETLGPLPLPDLDLDFRAHVESLEAEMGRASRALSRDSGERAVLVAVGTKDRTEAESRIAELKELARTAEVTVIDELIQMRRVPDPRYVIGRGKLRDIVFRAMQKGAELLIFDRELSPSQARAIAESTDLRVIDRTQLILDIFARRAQSRDGKLQVELAQLKYRLPRLRGRGDALSRLAGGIGGRGPGETRLEIDRRRVRERITRLDKEIANLSRKRDVARGRRTRHGLPIISIVGYTNAGKSTFLNRLTASEVLADNLLFATLDTSTRRLRFPEEREVIITDTVGFIRELPADLVNAFRATLEELNEADLLLHVVDASDPAHPQQIKAVESILDELDLLSVPRILVFNKMDQMDALEAVAVAQDHDAFLISAIEGTGIERVLEEAEARLFQKWDRPGKQKSA